jgi:hypothetical protein
MYTYTCDECIHTDMTTGCLYVYTYVSIRQHTSELKRMLTYACMYTYRYDDGLPVCIHIRQHTSAYVRAEAYVYI